jgi:DNA-binding PadR family transcriptional regulator
MIRNHLKTIVLKTLEHEKLSGYDLAKEIHRSTGHWKPSYGSIYPLLKELRNNSLVDVHMTGRKKVYNITTYGKSKLKELIKSREATIETLSKEFKIMESLCNDEEKKYMTLIFNGLKARNMPFGPVINEIELFQRTMLNLIATGQAKKHEKEIRTTLKHAIQDLRSFEAHHGR